jgi:outer membrane protein assembly factor BamD (BamD/ComL family)
MHELKTTTDVVKRILEEHKQTRNSDSLLYLKVLEYYADMACIDLRLVSVENFFKYFDTSPFPPSESVRRARQKIQATFPELAANDRVRAFRAENEQIFKAYALGVIE